MRRMTLRAGFAAASLILCSTTGYAKSVEQDNASPLRGWWDQTTISGVAFVDISNIDSHNGGVASTNNGTSFDVKRMFIGIDHRFNDVFSANLTTDTVYNSAQNSSSIVVKMAYLQINLDDRLMVRLGCSSMPWIPYVDGVSGYRYIEPSLIDRTGFGHGEDWGVHALGSFARGLISYQFSAVNGAGFRKTARAESIDLEGRVSLNYKGVQLAVGGYSGKEGTQHGAVTHYTYNRINFLAAYSVAGFRIGGEYFNASNQGNETGLVPTQGVGYSLFASYRFNPRWSVFGRTDRVRPFSQDAYHKAFRNTFYYAGVSYSPLPEIDFALVYKHDGGSNGSFTDANGLIGGSFATASASGSSGNYNETGLFMQYHW